MRKVIMMATLLLGVGYAGMSAGADNLYVHSFEKIQLSDVFYSEGAHFADFNNDGAMDVVAGPYWYAGPDFQERHEYYPPRPFDKNGYSDNFFAWTDDLNGDGWQDIIIGGFPGQDASWFENPHHPSSFGHPHWTQHRILDGLDNESPHYTDITGDGKRELVFHFKGQWGWAGPDPSDPTQPWTFHAVAPKGNYQRFTHGMGVGDVNGDGRMDILEKGGWWEHPADDSSGEFWKKHEVDFAPGGYGGAQMFAYDFDGDGDNDVVSSSQAHAYGLYWFEQIPRDGKITFRPHAIMDPELQTDPRANRYGVVFSQMHAFDLVDMDRDGIKDIVTGKRYWAHNGHDPHARGMPVVYWFKTVRGAQGMDFVPFLIDGSAGVGTQVVAGDLNGDEWPDVVIGNKAGAFALIHRVRPVDAAQYRESFPRPYRLAKVGDHFASEPPPAQPARGVLPRRGELNLGFERGDLSGWTAEGDAFAGMPLKGDATVVKRRNMRAGVEGEFWIGTYELEGDRPRGTLTSAPFTVTHPYASFLVGGGHYLSTGVELVNAESGEVIFRASGIDSEAMRRVAVDLRPLQGKTIFVRLVDRHTGHWGHVNYDDFRFHDERPYIPPEQRLLSRDVYEYAGLSGEEAAKRMTLPYGFRATLFAAEPDVRQPIAFCIDDRGRVWVAEAYSYPIRRADDEAKDRILIFEDTDGDGRFDKRKIFAERLNLVSGLEVGFGGVWVGAAPHLLFIPDRNGDDVPDGRPRVLLDGWGYQDTHETLNAFIWGPDGWLYGCHGVFTHSRVGKPGTPEAERTPLNAAVWRYHPTRHEFDVFCRGTSNPWGVDWNDLGQSFLTACVIPHLFHVIQGARYHRQGGRHFNPHVYDDIKTIADHRHYVGPNPHGGNDRSDILGGGHAHCGAMVYLGDAWPASYRNRLFMNNIHGQRVNVDRLVEKGSGYVGHHADDFLLTNDRWSQGLNLRYGPDGQVYLIDWYDQNACHHRRLDGHDRSNGRIYKITYGEPSLTQVDLKLRSDVELAELQLHQNDWYVRHARRLLQERSASRKLKDAAVDRLEEIAFEHRHEARRLRGLWALHATGNLTGELAERALGDYSPYVRGWAIQLIMEDRAPSKAHLERFSEMARKDPSQVVRLYLASALQRLPQEHRWDLLAGLLAHKEDATDHNLPLMYWYGSEPLAEVDAERALRLASSSQVPLILSYMVRRIASEGTPESLALLVKTLGETESASRQNLLVEGINTALRGRRRVPMPETWPSVYSRLAQAGTPELRAQLKALAVTFGDPRALAAMRELLENREADVARRRAALESLLGAKDQHLASSLQALLDESALRGAALRALAAYDDSKTPRSILAVYSSLSLSEKRDALNTLASRVRYAGPLLEAIARKEISASDLSADVVRQLRNLRDDDIEKKIAEVWGVVRAVQRDKAATINQLRRVLRKQPRPRPDLVTGRGIFVKTCQQCHTLFGVGGKVGPELTGSNRSDLDYILSNVVDPSAVLQNEYKPYVFVTADGRVVTGLIQNEDQNAYTIATANDTVILPKNEIATTEKTDQSMMPEDLLTPLTEDEVRDLVAYLASPVQVPLKATPDTVGTFFSEKDLTGWAGDEKLWSVENGEIIGRSPGLQRNEFLRSELVLADFRLGFRVKLTPNAGNSGIQFRSQSLPHGEVKGYQADVGQGWWGKLYEENGRALLWDKSGEQHVRLEEWNDYEIVAVGSRIRTYINGQLCVDLEDPDGAREGIIALQMHSGPAIEVRYRDFSLELDPKL